MKNSGGVRASCCCIILFISMMIGPVLVAAHGWKAPTNAAQKSNPVPISESSIQRGAEIYRGLCAACHGAKAAGDGEMAASFIPEPANLLKRLKNHSEGDFFWKISNGRGPMPGFKDKLTEKQIWDVINFIKSL